MFYSIRLYFKYIAMSVRAQMQYRGSFIILTLGSFAITFVEFISIAILFSRFGTLDGWTLAEVALCYGMVAISFGFSEAFGRGFDVFARQVITGDFDRTLLRPRTTALQVLGTDFQLMRSGRMLQGAALFVWASVTIGIDWDINKIALVLVSITGGVMIFTGLLIMQAAMCFWSTQSLEMMNSFTYGGVEATQWPVSIYLRWFTNFFIFIIPLACVNYFPVLAVLDKPDVLGFPQWFQWISPLTGYLFFSISLLIWNHGVSHYRSTGS